MSLNDTMKEHMDAVRAMSGTSEKLSLANSTKIISSAGQWGVHVPNLVKNSSAEYQKFTSKGDTFNIGSLPIKKNTRYSMHVTVNDMNVPVNAYAALYNSSWGWITAIAGNDSVKAGQEGIIHLTFTPNQDGFVELNIQSGDKSASPAGNYKRLMVNQGDYAPYTSATEAYTVDELAERIETLENKLGGATKPVLIGFVAPRLEVAA